MKRLSFTQKNIMRGLNIVGTALVIVDFSIPVVTLTMGYVLILMSTILLFLECGPEVWYWWVPLGMGSEHELPIAIYEHKHMEIFEWIMENIKKSSISCYHYGNKFYFLRETDAVAFKLAWEE